MFFIIIGALSLTLIYLMIRDSNELRRNKRNIGCGWKITPYVNSKISSFENRIDLEKLRICELIKNKLLFDKKFKIIENDNNSLYIKSGTEIRFLEVFSENETREVEKREFRYKLGRDEECVVYNSVRNIIKNHTWDFEEENLGSYGQRIYLNFKSGIVILDVSKVNEIILMGNAENDYIKR